mmetsp:Transcript_56288/g.89232  ORF Transcript_56288/g.89232 Transcript_56288/m.89232 type:complete len:224 (+) Transcript_56288:214-885(+)
MAASILMPLSSWRLLLVTRNQSGLDPPHILMPLSSGQQLLLIATNRPAWVPASILIPLSTGRHPPLVAKKPAWVISSILGGGRQPPFVWDRLLLLFDRQLRRFVLGKPSALDWTSRRMLGRNTFRCPCLRYVSRGNGPGCLGFHVQHFAWSIQVPHGRWCPGLSLIWGCWFQLFGAQGKGNRLTGNDPFRWHHSLWRSACCLWRFTPEDLNLLWTLNLIRRHC